MPATFTGPLARRLNGLCALEILEVTRPTPIVPGQVYIGKGDADIVVAARPGGLVALAAPSRPDYPWHPSVDRLVTTALDQVGAPRLIGVLMTGMGRDGADAMTRLRREGGRTIAEAEETAIVWGMPGELVKAGGADLVVPLDDIAGHMIALVRSTPHAR
jgi:two-component system chemotaxis response regulator CheB